MDGVLVWFPRYTGTNFYGFSTPYVVICFLRGVGSLYVPQAMVMAIGNGRSDNSFFSSYSPLEISQAVVEKQKEKQTPQQVQHPELFLKL